MPDFLFLPISKASGKTIRIKKIMIKLWAAIKYFNVKVRLKLHIHNIKDLRLRAEFSYSMALIYKPGKHFSRIF